MGKVSSYPLITGSALLAADQFLVVDTALAPVLSTKTITFSELQGVFGAGTSSTTGFWNFATSTTMADPGNGKLRFNNGTITAASQLAISVRTSPGTDVTPLLRSLGA